MLPAATTPATCDVTSALHGWICRCQCLKENRMVAIMYQKNAPDHHRPGAFFMVNGVYFAGSA
jgi:hypothetical protein